GCGSHHNPVTVAAGQIQQIVAHRATHHIRIQALERGIGRWGVAPVGGGNGHAVCVVAGLGAAHGKATLRFGAGEITPKRSLSRCGSPLNNRAYYTAFDITFFTYSRVSVNGIVSAKMAPSTGAASFARHCTGRRGPAL